MVIRYSSQGFVRLSSFKNWFLHVKLVFAMSMTSADLEIRVQTLDGWEVIIKFPVV